MDDSNSDWDSMSEAVPLPIAATRLAKEEPPAKTVPVQNELPKSQPSTKNAPSAPKSSQPPFDFSTESPAQQPQPSAAGRPPGKSQPRSKSAYKPTLSPNPPSVQSKPRMTTTTAAAKTTSSSSSRGNSGAGGGKTAGQQPPRRQSVESTNGSVNTVVSSSGKSPKQPSTKPVSRSPAAVVTPPFKESSKGKGDDEDESDMDEDEDEDGFDNLAFQDDSYEIEERPDSSEDSEQSGKKKKNGKKKKPSPDEKIVVYKFQRPVDSYFQVCDQTHGVWADKLTPAVSSGCNWCIAEILGLLKIPFIVVFIIVGQIIQFLIYGFLQPFSDFVLKPILVSFHNLILVPLFGLCYNFCEVCAHSMLPVCKLCSDHCCCGGNRGGRRVGGGEGKSHQRSGRHDVKMV